MDLKKDVEKIMNSKVFKDLNKKLYLCSCFNVDGKWQFAFYNKKEKKITSFFMDKKIKIIGQDSKVFQKDDVILEKLKLDKVKISLDEALRIAEGVKESKIKADKINKKIIILQCIKVPLWNISFITNSFNLFNIKLNANSGEIISENYEPILNFKAKV